MYQINLPSYDVKVGGTQEKPTIFDVLRRKYVALTPEEWVRQHFVHYLIDYKGYPSGLIGNELELHIGRKKLRCDTIVYNRELRPLMIIEYKAPSVEITSKVFEQVTAYNMLLHVDYLVVSNGLSHYCCKMDYAQRGYDFLKEIPSYSQL